MRANTNSDTELDQLEQYEGEALFARALAYSELIKCFCKAYDNDEQAATGFGRGNHQSTTRAMSPRSVPRCKESYEFVFSDLDKATEYLKVGEDFTGSSTTRSYFNEYTCHALRARVSLYMHKYDDAIKYASKVIGSKFYTLEKASSQHLTQGNRLQLSGPMVIRREAIWKVGFTVNSYGGALGTIFDNYHYVSLPSRLRA